MDEAGSQSAGVERNEGGEPIEGVDLSDGDAVLAFWELARRNVGLGRLGVIVGPSPTESVPPPAWAFGFSPELADALLALVLEGTKTATASALWEYEAEAEPLPQEGDLSIILDGRGHPRALIRTTGVRVVPFDEVDAEHAWLEGEGDRSLQAWRADHRVAFGLRVAARDAQGTSALEAEQGSADEAALEGALADGAPDDGTLDGTLDGALYGALDEGMAVVLERFELRFPQRSHPGHPGHPEHQGHEDHIPR